VICTNLSIFSTIADIMTGIDLALVYHNTEEVINVWLEDPLLLAGFTLGPCRVWSHVEFERISYIRIDLR